MGRLLLVGGGAGAGATLAGAGFHMDPLWVFIFAVTVGVALLGLGDLISPPTVSRAESSAGTPQPRP